MSYERPLTIKETIQNVHSKKYLLPAIQREFVWDTDQIEKLFDSLLRDYPIGSFLFWHVEKEKSKDFQFYEFIRNYHERDERHNPKANISGSEDITAILDGQQRLTALYIGLKGTYAYKLPYKRWDNDSAYPKRMLYLNLLNEADNADVEYDFQFLTKEEAKKRDGNTYWFKVSDVLDIREQYEINNYLIENELNLGGKKKAKFANKALFKLHKVIHDVECIFYFLEKGEELDKVLQIFIRVNSGGTQLSYSDLLLSIATAQWKHKDAREEITTFVDEINNIGNGFNFDKDFVLKTCLVLCDFRDIAFKVDNFNKENMIIIEKTWDNISDAIDLATKLVSSFGYDRDTLTSNAAIIPLAYYLLKKGVPHNFVQSSKYSDDRKKINKWLILSLLKRAFSGQPDNVLRPTRQVLSENNSVYPLDEIIHKFKGGTKSLIFGKDDIDNLFEYRYGQSYTFSTLALLYPTLDFKNIFHVDHIFPKSYFTRRKLLRKGIGESKIEFYLDNYNYLANLQLIDGIQNQEKLDTPFKDWLINTFPNKQERKEFMLRNYIPDIDLSLSNFDSFVNGRIKLMTNKFKSILK